MSLTDTGPAVESLSPPSRRRPSWIAAGVLLIALSGLLGAYLYSVSTSTITIVVANADLAPGDVIDRGDLRVVEMGEAGNLRAIPADQQDLIIGSTPRAFIPSGTILNTDLFVDAGLAIPEGQILLGAWLEPGEAAVPRLPVGAEIVLLGAGAEGATAIGNATVWGVYTDAGGTLGDSMWVSFLVDRSIEGEASRVIEAGELRIGQVGP